MSDAETIERLLEAQTPIQRIKTLKRVVEYIDMAGVLMPGDVEALIPHIQASRDELTGIIYTVQRVCNEERRRRMHAHTQALVDAHIKASLEANS